MKYVDMLLSLRFAWFVLAEWCEGGSLLVPMVLALGRIGLSVAIWIRSRWLLWFALIYIYSLWHTTMLLPRCSAQPGSWCRWLG